MIGLATGVRTAMCVASLHVDMVGTTGTALVVGTVNGTACYASFIAAATVGGTAAIGTAGFRFKAFATGTTVCVTVALTFDFNVVSGAIPLLIVRTRVCTA